MATEAFVDLLLSSFRGQIVACNIVDGLHAGTFNGVFAGEVLRWWEHLASHSGFRRSEDLVEALNIVRERDYPPGMPASRAAPDLRCASSSGLDPTERHGEICCAVPGSILQNLIEKADLDRLIASGVSFPATQSSPWALSSLRALMSLRTSECIVHLDATKSFGRTNGILWFTRKLSLTRVLRASRPRQAPDHVRDVLGLIHRKQGELLMLLFFPASILGGHKSARPTFVDAGNHSRFKSTGSSRSASGISNWGWTANLEKFYNAMPSIDGCRERVCNAISRPILPVGGQFSFLPLGIVAVPRGDVEGVHDDKFAGLLRKGRTVDDLKRELIALP